MFVVTGQQAEAQIREQGEIDGIVEVLRERGYRPVLRSMLNAAAEAAGVRPGTVPVSAVVRSQTAYRNLELQGSASGDLFFVENRSYVLQPVATRLQVWEMRRHDCDSALAAFCDDVEAATRSSLDGRRLRGMDFTWKAIRERPTRRLAVRSRLYKEQKLETRAPDYVEDEAAAARLLVSPAARSLLLRLAQLGKARSVDAAADADTAMASQMVDIGLVRREYIVLCRQDSHTICVTKDRTELDAGAGGAFVCSICGRLFKDELVQEIFAVTNFGKSLLSGSRWMTIWITDLLIGAGIARDEIAWNAVAAEDELDIMTDALGPRVFFELKDREFGLGDAYPFAYRVNRYGGLFGVVVSTEQVAAEAKRFFEEQRQTMEARIEWIEGPEAISTNICSLVDRVSRSGVNQLLIDLSESIGINLVPIARSWMDEITQRTTPNQALQPVVPLLT